MASFGSLAPGMGDENDLLSSPQYTYGLPFSTPPQPDWREQEAQAGLAAEREAARPSGLSTFWSAIKHPSLYPMISGMMGAEEAPKTPITRTDLPDVGPPLISPGPQISGGTAIGRAIQGPLYEGTRGALASGLTAPHRAITGQIPMYGPTGGTSEEMVQAGSDLAALAGGASVAGTLERAASTPGLDMRLFGKQILASDTGAPGAAVSIAEHAPQYTTGIEGALSRIPSNELTAAQWANQLKRFGAKPEEMEWRQLGPALEGLGNAKISKAGIEEHLANNPVGLKPIEKTAPVWEYLNSEQQHWVYDQWRDHGGPTDSGYDTPKDYYEALGGSSGLPKSIFHGNPEYPDYTLPGGTNYRERLMTLPETAGLNEGNQAAALAKTLREKYGERWSTEAPPDQINLYHDLLDAADARPRSAQFTNQHGSHWEEPNVLFHRRSTDREFEQPLPPEHEAQNQQRMAMLERADNLRQQQGQVGMEITKIARPYDQARNKRIYEDMRAGRITPQEAERQMSIYELPPEIKPLQDKLQALRADEDELRRTAPEQIQPQTVQSLHDEENQSDWHQQGRDKGYIIKPKDEELPGPGTIPNAPFKGTAWERLALHDQLREAAEKGYPRISWTAGEENPTNPLAMLKKSGRALGTLDPGRQAEVLRADRGIRDYYNRRRVDQANKIGKAHGVQVERSMLPADENMTVAQAIAQLGIDPSHEAELRRQFSISPKPVEIPSGELKGQKLTASQLIGAAKRKGLATYHMDIPDSLRRELLTKPMSLFEDSGEAGKAVAIARQAEQPKAGGLEFPAAEAADRLRLKTQREAKAAATGEDLAGKPINPRTVIKAPKAKKGETQLPDFVAGDITPQDWVDRHEKILSPDEIKAASNWYNTIYGQFLQHTNGDEDLAKKYMRAWLVGQQNVDVGGSMANMMLQREQILRGVPEGKMKAAAMPNPTMASRAVMRDQPISGGVGQKISDFVDAAEGKNVRSWMGNHPAGGSPFVVDIHTARDTGLVDPILKKHLTKLGYDKKAVDKLKVDLPGTPTATQYENRAGFGHDLTDHLNKIKWQGRSNWTPAEAQAVGWMGMTKLTADQAEDVMSGLRSTMRHVSMEVAPGKGSPWDLKYGQRFSALSPENQRLITNEVTRDAIDRASQMAGVDVRNIVHGTGGWKTFENPSAVAQTFSSKEGAEIAANVLGHLLNQEEVWSNKIKPLTSSPKGFAVDIIGSGNHQLGTDEGLRDAWGKIMAADPTAASKSPLFQGYQPIQTSDGRRGIRVLVDRGGKVTAKSLEDAVNGPIKKALEALPGDYEAKFWEAEINKATNDWKRNKNGQGYSSRLGTLLGRDPTADLRTHGAALEKKLSGLLDAAEGRGGTAPAAPAAKATSILREDTGEAGKAASVARQIEQKTPTYDSWHDALEGRKSGTGQGHQQFMSPEEMAEEMRGWQRHLIKQSRPPVSIPLSPGFRKNPSGSATKSLFPGQVQKPKT